MSDLNLQAHRALMTHDGVQLDRRVLPHPIRSANERETERKERQQRSKQF